MSNFWRGALFGYIAGAIIALIVVVARMEGNAVKNNAGHYETKTGNFVWGPPDEQCD